MKVPQRFERKVSEEEKSLFEQHAKTVEFGRLGRKTTLCQVTLTNDFEITATAACVNPDIYDDDIGQEIALKRAIRGIDRYLKNMFME